MRSMCQGLLLMTVGEVDRTRDTNPESGCRVGVFALRAKEANMLRTSFGCFCLVIVSTLSLPYSSAAQAADPWVGTWRLNVARSTYSPGPAPKSSTLRIEAVAGGAQKHTFDGVNAQGQTTHSERIATFDGADVPVQAVMPPATAASTSAFRRIDARTFEVTGKVEGRLTTTNRIVVSADGKTMTQTTTGTNAQGQTVKNVAVYERQ